MRPEGHPIDSFNDLCVAFLLKLVVLGEKLEEMRKALFLVLQHHAFQLALEVEFLENRIAFDGASLSHLLAKLLLMKRHLLRRKLNAKQPDYRPQ